jgi:hypothetical protein
MLVNDMPTNKRNDMSTNLVLIFYFLLFRECFICFYLLYVFKKEIYTKMNDVLVNLTSGKTSKDKDFCTVCCCHRWMVSNIILFTVTKFKVHFCIVINIFDINLTQKDALRSFTTRGRCV